MTWTHLHNNPLRNLRNTCNNVGSALPPCDLFVPCIFSVPSFVMEHLQYRLDQNTAKINVNQKVLLAHIITLASLCSLCMAIFVACRRYTPCVKWLSLNEVRNLNGWCGSTYIRWFVTVKLTFSSKSRHASEYWPPTEIRQIQSSVLCVCIVDLWFARMLQCGRITIHKNLVASFIIRSVLFVVYFEPFVTDRQQSYRDIVRSPTKDNIYSTINSLWPYFALSSSNSTNSIKMNIAIYVELKLK